MGEEYGLNLHESRDEYSFAHFLITLYQFYQCAV